jgi:hypothetical protein
VNETLRQALALGRAAQAACVGEQAMQQYWQSFAGRFRQRPAVGAGLLLALLAIAAAAPADAQVAHFYDSLRGVHVAGYQGWFRCPGDGAGIGWGHWMRGRANTSDPKALTVDMWPDTSDLGPDERCPTGFRLPGGTIAYLFSNQNPKTVARHFQWMRQYGIDGAAMQRFLSDISREPIRRSFDRVLENARAAAEANRRGFFVMYDVTRKMDGETALRLIEDDWRHLTGTLRITDSPAYIYDRGKPVVAVWGLGVHDRKVSPEQAAAIIRILKTASVPAKVLGGVPASWRNLNSDGRWRDSQTDPQWDAVYRSLDIISPWAAGRFSDDRGANDFTRRRVIPDIEETRRLGIGYMPVVFPGYSARQISADSGLSRPLNSIPRRCGAFYRRQIDNVIRAGAVSLFTAMFDEVNEGMAIFKVAATEAQGPLGADLLSLDADGCASATSDMYLRLAGEANRALRARQ